MSSNRVSLKVPLESGHSGALAPEESQLAASGELRLGSRTGSAAVGGQKPETQEEGKAIKQQKPDKQELKELKKKEKLEKKEQKKREKLEKKELKEKEKLEKKKLKEKKEAKKVAT
jgi:hypothetical protein